MDENFETNPPEVPETEAPEYPKPTKPRLRAATALLILGVYLVGQIGGLSACVMIAGVAEGIKIGLNGGEIEDPDALGMEIMEGVLPIALVIGVLVGGALMVLLTRALLRDEIRDPSPQGAAWRLGRKPQLLVAFALGLALATLFTIVLPLLMPSPDASDLGPVAKMAQEAGASRAMWVVLAVLLAPVIEELLFRGALLGGLSRSFGLGWGIFLSAGIFVLLHFGEAFAYWPAFLAIGGLAVGTTWFRLKAKAVGPAIAMHFGYNSLLASAVVFFA